MAIKTEVKKTNHKRAYRVAAGKMLRHARAKAKKESTSVELELHRVILTVACIMLEDPISYIKEDIAKREKELEDLMRFEPPEKP